MSNDWTTVESLRHDLQRRWDRGYLLQGFFADSDLFPFRVRLKGPTTKDWITHFAQVQEWSKGFLDPWEASTFALEWNEVKHRILGSNRVPSHVVFCDLAQLAGFVQRTVEFERFVCNARLLLDAMPTLEPWLKAHPRDALIESTSWSQCIRLAQWMRDHPRPDIYLRQIPLPGIDTKFVQSHQGLLRSWLSELGAKEDSKTPAEDSPSFALRFGFLDKPALLRIRILDPLLRIQGFSDLSIRIDEFAQGEYAIKTWIVVENDITALSLPDIPCAAVIFGRGYGFEPMRKIAWLHHVKVFYWGDLDTHGFAILSQFRSLFPHAQSLLMDRATLLQHRDQWVCEDKPSNAQLSNLQADEAKLYEELIRNIWGTNIRLEQERIDFAWVRKRIDRL